MKKKIFALSVALLMCIATAGCSASQEKTTENSQEEIKTLIDVTDDGGLVANFDETDKGVGGGSGITINKGEYLVIDSQLTEGKVQVKVISSESNIDKVPIEDTTTAPTIDHEFEGVGETEYGMISAGDYMVFVDVNEKATGKINFIKKSDEKSSEASSEVSK